MLSIVSFPTCLWQFLSDTTEGSDSTIKITNDPWKETDFPHKQSFPETSCCQRAGGAGKENPAHCTLYQLFLGSSQWKDPERGD